MRRVLAWLLLASTLLLLAAPAPAAAQDDAPPGADIVFVVDQSGSMSKGTIKNNRDRRCAPERLPTCPRTAPSDPDGLALQAVRDGLEPIFERMVLRSLERGGADAAREEYRFGLVLFGGADTPEESVIAAVPLTRIEIARDAQGMLQPNVAAKLPSTPSNLGETAFSRAFGTVCAMLSCSTPTPPQRKRVVVLLTDGQPSLDEIGFDRTNPAPYFDKLRQKHADLFRNSEIWVLGLDGTDQFWSKNVPYWSQIAPGRTFHLLDPKDIAARFRAIAQQTVGAPAGTLRTCDAATFRVSPYRATLTLILEYPDARSRAQISLPDGAKLAKTSPELMGYTRTARSETFIVKDPQPGDWHCDLVGAGVAPRLRDVPGSFKLAGVRIEPLGGQPLSTCDDFNVSVGYLDADGAPIAELPRFPLAQTLTITVDGQTKTLALAPDGDARDRWKVAGGLRAGPTGGEYPARIEARLPDGTLVFSSTQQRIAVDPALPCLRIDAPSNGGVSPMDDGLNLAAVDLTVQLTQGGQPATAANMFQEDPSRIVSGRLDGPAHYSRPIELKPIAGRPDLLGARVRDLEASGTYTFTAVLKATTHAGAPYQLAPQVATFRRVPDPFWRMARQAVWAAELAAMAIAAALFAFGLFLITGPYPRGTLVLERRKSDAFAEALGWEKIASVALSRRRAFFGLFRTRWSTIKGQPLQGTGLKKIKVRRQVSGKDEGVQITLVRAEKKPQLAFSLLKDKEHKIFDAKYRITYETYGVSKKAR